MNRHNKSNQIWDQKIEKWLHTNNKQQSVRLINVCFCDFLEIKLKYIYSFKINNADKKRAALETN